MADGVPGGDITTASAAAQGLLAVEYLLYGPVEAGPEVQDGSRCRILVALAGNIETMASSIWSEWDSGDPPFRLTVTEPGVHDDWYETAREATLPLFKGLHDSLKLMSDIKLRRVIGKEIGSARPRQAESRLSERSMVNIIDTLKALRSLYEGEDGAGLGALVKDADPKLDTLLRKAFRLTIANAESIRHPVEAAAVDPAARPGVEKLAIQVQALAQIVRNRVSAALGLHAGFNSLDGD